MKQKILITGGAGFVGSNLADSLLRDGYHVTVFDALLRRGTEHNLAWLREQRHGSRFRFVRSDVRNFDAVRAAAADADVIYHLAGQVAVTSSVEDPRTDFEINALGTFNVLEAARLGGRRPLVVFTSTNKVYGGMEQTAVIERPTRYEYADLPFGVPESQPLDFHSPYGCCYSEDTDILTRRGWRRFPDLTSEDEVLTYNRDLGVAEFQRPTRYFVFPYEGKMYMQLNRRLRTCVTPNHKMFVASECTHAGLVNPRLIEAREIAGKPVAYLLAADVSGGRDQDEFIIPAVEGTKYKHSLPPKPVPMTDWLRFLGWYLSEGHCRADSDTGRYCVTLSTYYRHDEARAVLRAIGLQPCADGDHHITAASKQVCEYVQQFGKSHTKFIPQDIKELSAKHLTVLLQTLLDGDGNRHSKNGWRYTTVSKQLADDVQEVAIRCGLAARVCRDPEGFYRVYGCSTRTAQCNLGEDRSRWIDYDGTVYCVEAPNAVVMVRQGGCAYFSGNSKGAADQYVRDYARIYGLPTVVFRMSCIYGPRQFGNEDQGWLAHFMIAALTGKPITIYGNGKQVRDILFVGDLVRAFKLVVEKIDVAAGQVFNIGGGPDNTLAVWLEFRELLADLTGEKAPARFADWRPGDQPCYVSDIRKAKRCLGWEPQVDREAGARMLWDWVAAQEDLFAAPLSGPHYAGAAVRENV